MGLFGNDDPEVDDENKWENSENHSVGATDEELITSHIDNAENSATVKRVLSKNATNPHSALIHYLNNDEQVKYIFTYEKSGIQYVGENKYVSPRDESETSHIFTDERLITVVPQSDTDTVLELDYEELVKYKPNIDISFRKGKPRGNSTSMTVKTNNWKYRLHIDVKYADACEDCVHYIRKKMNPEYDRFLVTQGGQNMPPLSLSILDRETGEAKMETGGWNYGLGFIQRHSSTSKIEKEGYNTHASDFVITETGVQITYQEADGPDLIRMNRPFNQIGSVDITSDGFIIYCNDGIYKFDRQHDIKYTPEISEEDLNNGVEYLRSQVEAHSQTVEPASDTNDEFTKLENLAELKENGVITEDEFEEKKAELLDKI